MIISSSNSRIASNGAATIKKRKGCEALKAEFKIFEQPHKVEKKKKYKILVSTSRECKRTDFSRKYFSYLRAFFFLFIFYAITISSMMLLRGLHILPSIPSDPRFQRFQMSKRSFEAVRKSWNQNEEINRRKLEIVPLPKDFLGKYHPQNLQEFTGLANILIGDNFDSKQLRNSSIAIVCVCIDVEICVLSEPNHRAYATKQGYDYLFISKNVPGVHPKMLKYLALTWAINRGYEWLLMLDADTLVTNAENNVEATLSELSPSEETSLILTRGGNWRKLHVINNGVFLLKSNDWSLNHCFEVFTAKWSFTLFLGKTLIDQPVQLSLLLASNELSWPPIHEEEYGPHVMVVPKRRLNSFQRDAIHSVLDIREGAQWEPGDWIAHFASGKKFSLMIDLLKDMGMPTPPISVRFPFVDQIADSQETNVGTCWCHENLMKNRPSLSCIPRFHIIGSYERGMKTLTSHLDKHPHLQGSPIHEQATWLTDTVPNKMSLLCSEKRNKYESGQFSTRRPVFLGYGSNIQTCSFEDYALLHGKKLKDSASYKISENLCNNLASELRPEKAIFDQISVWDYSLSRVRGMALPEVFKLMHPTSQLLISLDSPQNVVYSSYLVSESHISTSHMRKKSQAFHELVQSTITDWTENQCSPSNYQICLKQENVLTGSWLTRAMFAPLLQAWLSQFDCSQLFIFDNNPFDMSGVQHLYEFIQASNNQTNYNTVKLQRGDNHRRRIDQTNYSEIQDQTLIHLEKFFAPYNYELCELISDYKCLQVDLLTDLCARGKRFISNHVEV